MNIGLILFCVIMSVPLLRIIFDILDKRKERREERYLRSSFEESAMPLIRSYDARSILEKCLNNLKKQSAWGCCRYIEDALALEDLTVSEAEDALNKTRELLLERQANHSICESPLWYDTAHVDAALVKLQEAGVWDINM